MKILFTGASGVMGTSAMSLLCNSEHYIRAFIPKDKNYKKFIKKYKKFKNIEIFTGDLRNYKDVYNALDGMDMIFHLAAIIPPLADINPKLAFNVNVGSVDNIISALNEKNMQDTCKFVFISSVAVYGDRQAPYHEGKVGDPIMPSMYDYYGLSKALAEQKIITSNIKQWSILRQTGIISPYMLNVRDSIIFHQPLNNILEYISDRDSGYLLKCIADNPKNELWQNIFNIGGGKDLVLSGYEIYSLSFNALGLKDFDKICDTKWFAKYNFHGMIFQDSHNLNDMYHYVRDGKEYIKHCMQINMKGFLPLINLLNKMPFIRKIAYAITKNIFKKLLTGSRGTLDAIVNQNAEKIYAMYGSIEEYNAIPDWDYFKNFKYNKAKEIDYGYDKNKAIEDISSKDILKGLHMRGAEVMSGTNKELSLNESIKLRCGCGHNFVSSAKNVLLYGHFCPYCLKNAWSYADQSRKDKLMAQIYLGIRNENKQHLSIKKDNNVCNVKFRKKLSYIKLKRKSKA